MVEITLLAEGLQFPESPTWSERDACLYFVEWLGDRVWRWAGGQPEVCFSLANGSGPSGLCQASDGTLWLSLFSACRVVQVTAAGQILRSFDGCQGVPFRGPNDIVCTRAGGVYFTEAGDFEQDWTTGRPIGRVVFIPPGGEPRLVDSGLCYPNGIALAPDEGCLYVDEHRQNRILRYRVLEDGGLAGRQVFFQMDANCLLEAERCFELGPDGLCVDRAGVLWVAHYGGGKVAVVSPEGGLLGLLRLPRGRLPTSTAVQGQTGEVFVTEAELGLLLRFPTAVGKVFYG